MDLLYFCSPYIQSLLLLFTLDLFLNHFHTCRPKKKQLPIRILFIILWACIDLSPFISYNFTLTLVSDFLYAMLILTGKLRTKLFVFFKYELFYILGSVTVAVLHTLLTWDIAIYGANGIYAEYTNILGSFYLYIIMNMYIISQKLSDFPSGKIYRRYFMAITTITVILLVLCSMILGSTIINEEYVVPLIFSLLLLISFLCISIYRKVVTVLEQNANAKMEAEINALQQDYQEHIAENLKTLSTLRHDFKNHMLIIQEYTRTGDLEKLQSYISSIHKELVPTALIDTPSHLISSLLNAKNETCKRKGIKLIFKHDFDNINIDDFHIVTILSNLIDNAITATEKCENGYIDLTISKINSYLEINCVNNHHENIVVRNNIFQTTKTTQKEFHGIGLISVRKTVEKLRGNIKIDYTEDSFQINILIPNY